MNNPLKALTGLFLALMVASGLQARPTLYLGGGTSSIEGGDQSYPLKRGYHGRFALGFPNDSGETTWELAAFQFERAAQSDSALTVIVPDMNGGDIGEFVGQRPAH